MTQKQKEARRMRAAGLIEKGWPVPAVARRLGVGENIVYVWRKKLREGGRQALEARPLTGPEHRLDEHEREELRGLVEAGPEASGYGTQIWSLPLIADLVLRRFGVSYDPGHLSRVLHGIGLSWQKPRAKAAERDEEAIERWRREEAARIAGKPRRRGRRSSSPTKPASRRSPR